jgi:hypothetical protein
MNVVEAGITLALFTMLVAFSYATIMYLGAVYQIKKEIKRKELEDE